MFYWLSLHNRLEQIALVNHIKNLVLVDFFTVPTIRFQVLYMFLVLAHDRRVFERQARADPALVGVGSDGQ
jgi:hypothetical protein